MKTLQWQIQEGSLGSLTHFFIISWRFSEILVKIGSPRGIFDKARNHFVTCFVHKIVIKQLFNRMCFVCLFVCLFL